VLVQNWDSVVELTVQGIVVREADRSTRAVRPGDAVSVCRTGKQGYQQDRRESNHFEPP
jgi:hypothetical protein